MKTSPFNRKRVAISAFIAGALAYTAFSPFTEFGAFEIYRHERNSHEEAAAWTAALTAAVPLRAAAGNIIPQPADPFAPRPLDLVALLAATVITLIGVVTSGLACASVVWFGPGLLSICSRLLGRYLRWLRTTD